MTTTYLCKQCGRPGELRDNQTYCDTCGPGVELVAVRGDGGVNTCERHGRIRCGECAYIEQLEEDRDKLIEVLRWYADKTNYVQEAHHLRHGTLIGPAEAIYYDEGQRARDILKEIGVTVE
jgi:hypothetical protein